MKCPNCGVENSEGAAECAGCQVVFAKWKGRGEAKAPPLPAEKSVNASPAPKILALLALAAVPAWLFLKPAAERKAPASVPPSATTEAPAVHAEGRQPDPGPGEPAAAQSPWKFEGSVIDLLTETPVEGAGLKFYSNSGGETFQALTDGAGRYSLDLKPLEKGGYGVFITHSGYGNQHWDAGHAKKPLKEKCRLGQGVQFMGAGELTRHVSTPGGTAVYDFAVYPNSLEKLTEEEKAECWRGISGR